MGYCGQRKVTDVLIKGLKCLEYRGYDSAGVAYFNKGQIEIKKAEGKISNVEKLLDGVELGGDQCGIGHTRWATHGRPTQENAHPHRIDHVVLAHNGIIENYQEIRRQILSRGDHPKSETDSELFGFLVIEAMKKGASFLDALRETMLKVEGSNSVVIMSEKHEGIIVGIRNGSPLVAAKDADNGVIIASDVQPVLEYSRDVVYLENGDMVVGDRNGLSFYDLKTGEIITRPTVHVDWSPEGVHKRGYAHYMLKEILEQPHAMIDTINSVIEKDRSEPFPLVEQPAVEILRKAKQLVFVACGTSWHTALLGKYWMEQLAGIPVSVELASEFLYLDSVVNPDAVVVGISQSGETADTLAVIRKVRAKGIKTLAITNVRQSSISREADGTFYIAAGPEIGVAATKTFTASNLMVLLCAGYLSSIRSHRSKDEISRMYAQVIRMPNLLDSALKDKSPFVRACNEAAVKLFKHKGFFFIGRGYSFPIALEGALKLKEIAYIHAEGYAGGELKHGPIAMIDKDMVVVVLAPYDRWREKTLSNLQEVKARGAVILGVGNPDDDVLKSQSDVWIPLPLPDSAFLSIDVSLYPFLLNPVVQLLSYGIAVLKGTDVDQPRNLAKSVTVE